MLREQIAFAIQIQKRHIRIPVTAAAAAAAACRHVLGSRTQLDLIELAMKNLTLLEKLPLARQQFVHLEEKNQKFKRKKYFSKINYLFCV